MTAVLFAVAANTLGLRYCIDDIQRIENCLTRNFAFRATLNDGSTSLSGDIITKLHDCIDNLDIGDTCILYFSGHSILEYGRLYFLLGDNAAKRSSVIDLQHVLDDFKYARATNRLVILDCCHATRATQAWAMVPSDKYLVLAASQFMEHAKEIPSLCGGFLTVSLCSILSSPPRDLARGYHQEIPIQSLYRVLQREARRYQQQHPEDNVAEPSLLGNQRTDFTLVHVQRHRAVSVLRAIGEADRGLTLAALKGMCSELSDSELNSSLEGLRADGYIHELHGIIFALGSGHDFLQSLTM